MGKNSPKDAFSDDGAKKVVHNDEKPTSPSTGGSVIGYAIVTSILSISVAGAVILAMAVTIATEETDNVATRREIMIGVGVPLIIASNVLCACILYFLLNPISQLAQWMKKKTASSLEFGNFASSRIKEVQIIFGAFEDVKDKFEKVKKFIPAAMLAQIESDSDDNDFEDNDDDDDEGEVKSVFGRTTESVDHQNIQALRHGSRVESTSLVRSTMTNPISQSDTDVHKQDGTTKYSAIHRTRSASHLAGGRMTKELLVSRSVSIVAFNLRDFHFSTQHADEGSLEQNYGVLLDQFQLIAKEHRGILDSFHGDRFHFTFNAVKPCHSHPTMATTAALKIAQHMASQSSHHSAIGSRVTCGVATGRCLVGNLGNERSKRFSVIGAPYTQATVLERLCKRYFNTSVLLSAETAVECETHVAFMFMGLIDSPGGRNHPIAAAKYVKSAKSELADEWMYEVQDQDANCDYHTGNMAFRALLRGDIPLARKYLQNFNMKYVEAAEIKRLLESFIKTGLKPIDLGPYYNECIMSN